MSDDTPVQRSIELAVEAAAAGNRPFGAVLVSSTGAVLAEGRNEVASSGDVTAHAEIVALRRATSAGRADAFPAAVMYASGEPCPMCSAALVWSGIGRVVYAASEPGFAGLFPDGPRFRLRCADVVAAADVGIEVVGPVLEQAALDAMRGR